jgi:hypothetical protein
LPNVIYFSTYIDELLENPKLYQNIAKNRLLSPWQGLLWFLEGLWHSVVTYFAFYLIWSLNLNSVPVEFTTQEKFSFGLAIYQCVLVGTLCFMTSF